MLFNTVPQDLTMIRRRLSPSTQIRNRQQIALRVVMTLAGGAAVLLAAWMFFQQATTSDPVNDPPAQTGQPSRPADKPAEAPKKP
ncbi:MAG: hypothetical protein EAZ89_12800 [Bacteroidetes bacterium]|nr:MAG: hypothetical protein EAZ89_12800 [Bacteroidota bacterium]